MVPAFGNRLAIARSQDHRQLRALAAKFAGQCQATHAGHDHIGKHCIKITCRASQLRQRFFCRPCIADLVAVVLEELSCETAQVGIVFYHQYSSPLALYLWLAAGRGVFGRGCSWGLLRQIQGKGGALAGDAVHLYIAPDCLAKPNTCDNPSPVPSPGALVVKNGSKMRSSNSVAIPTPLSLTDIAANGPGCEG